MEYTNVRVIACKQLIIFAFKPLLQAYKDILPKRSWQLHKILLKLPKKPFDPGFKIQNNAYK